MHKSINFILVLFLTLLVTIPHTSALDNVLEQKVNEVESTVNKLSNQQARDEYLKEQWGAFLNNTTAGKYIRESERQLKSLDFAWKFFFGLPFSWSFLFIFSFILWIALGTWIKRLLAFLELWDPKLHWIVGFGAATLASALGLERTLATLAVKFTQGFNILGINALVMQFILQIALIIGVLYVGMFTSVWENTFKNIKAAWEEKKLKKEVQELKKEREYRKLEDGSYDIYENGKRTGWARDRRSAENA
jgi:hypothetical protein